MMKNNLPYYRHMSDSHNHWKMKTLRREYFKKFGKDGWAGEGKFWALNNMIANSSNCKLCLTDMNRKRAIAIELDFGLKEFDEFIKLLSQECKLVKYEHGILTTKITQECLYEVSKKREYQRKWKNEKYNSKTEESKLKNQKSNIENEQTKKKENNINLTKVKNNNDDFDFFWDLYDKKVGKEKSHEIWETLTNEEKRTAIAHIPKYKLSIPDKQFRKNPERYLKEKAFNDEILISNNELYESNSKLKTADDLREEQSNMILNTQLKQRIYEPINNFRKN